MSVDPPGVLYVITVLLVGFVIVGLPRLIEAVARRRARQRTEATDVLEAVARRRARQRAQYATVPDLPPGYHLRVVETTFDGILVAQLEREIPHSDSSGNTYTDWEVVDRVSIVTDGDEVTPIRVGYALHTLAEYARRRESQQRWAGEYQPGDPLEPRG
jgi:hypothetical protein